MEKRKLELALIEPSLSLFSGGRVQEHASSINSKRIFGIKKEVVISFGLF
jgi:hypothetical protein